MPPRCSIIDPMSELKNHMSKLSFLCPLCNGYTFSQHWMAEYSVQWNKCQSCGYMEEKTVSHNRILNKLCPDQLQEKFIDPVTSDIIEQSTQIGIYGKTKKRKKNSKASTDCPTTKNS